MKPREILISSLFIFFCGLGLGVLITVENIKPEVEAIADQNDTLEMKVEQLIVSSKGEGKSNYKTAVLSYCLSNEITDLDFKAVDSIYMSIDPEVQHYLDSMRREMYWVLF